MNDASDGERLEQAEETERRPYEAPAIEETGNFESLALTCLFSDPFGDCAGSTGDVS